MTERTARELAYIRAAQELTREGELEVDPDAIVSEGDDPGAYVQAWVWVPRPDDLEAIEGQWT